MSSETVMEEYQTFFILNIFALLKRLFSNGLAAPVYGLTVVTSVSCKVGRSCMQCVSELWLSLYRI